jgi:hypothetical protein
MAPNTVLSTTAPVAGGFFKARKSEHGIQGYNVLIARRYDMSIIAVIRPACKHLSSKSRKIIEGLKTSLGLAKDDC